MARRKQKIELWLGLLVIVSCVLLLWGYFWLTGQPLGERGYTVQVLLPNAEGLERGDRVRLSGVEVGVVRSVRLVSSEEVAVSLWLHRDLRLPNDSRALLQSVGVFGDRIVVLQPGASPNLAADGDTLAIGRTTGLMELAGDLGEQADAVLVQVRKLLDDQAIEDVHASIESLPSTIRGLERLARDGGAEFEELSRSLRQTADLLRSKVEGAGVDQLLADIEATAATMSETSEMLRETSESLRSIAEKIDRGDGTLGLLVNDTGLYDDLRQAVQNVSTLSQDIHQNPSRYIKLSVF